MIFIVRESGSAERYKTAAAADVSCIIVQRVTDKFTVLSTAHSFARLSSGIWRHSNVSEREVDRDEYFQTRLTSFTVVVLLSHRV